MVRRRALMHPPQPSALSLIHIFFDAKHEMIRKLVRQFAETELTTEVLDKVEETGEFPEEIVDKRAKCGFLGLKIPREYGGAGADTLAYRCV